MLFWHFFFGKPGQFQALQTIAKPTIRLPKKKPAASDDQVTTDPTGKYRSCTGLEAACPTQEPTSAKGRTLSGIPEDLHVNSQARLRFQALTGFFLQ